MCQQCSAHSTGLARHSALECTLGWPGDPARLGSGEQGAAGPAELQLRLLSGERGGGRAGFTCTPSSRTFGLRSTPQQLRRPGLATELPHSAQVPDRAAACQAGAAFMCSNLRLMFRPPIRFSRHYSQHKILICSIRIENDTKSISCDSTVIIPPCQGAVAGWRLVHSV